MNEDSIPAFTSVKVSRSCAREHLYKTHIVFRAMQLLKQLLKSEQESRNNSVRLNQESLLLINAFNLTWFICEVTLIFIIARRIFNVPSPRKRSLHRRGNATDVTRRVNAEQIQTCGGLFHFLLCEIF